MAKIITPLSDRVPIVNEDRSATPYFKRILEDISDAALTSAVVDGIAGGDPDADRVLVWDDTLGELTYISVSALLDWLGSEARGDILYRGLSGWALLPAGTAGKYLTTGGAGADPSWTAPANDIAVITILVSDPSGAAITTGDGKAYWRVPDTLNGANLIKVAAHVTTVSSSGTPTVQIANVTDSVDMLSTKITIDANEKDSSTATTPAVIDTTKDDVATADELRIDIDVAGTGAKGLIVEMQFQVP